MLLDEVWKAQETLKPQRPIVEDHTEALDDMKRTNSELSRALELANRRNEELEAELKRLRDINAGMVPAIELDDLRNQLENMKRLMADMVPKDQVPSFHLAFIHNFRSRVPGSSFTWHGSTTRWRRRCRASSRSCATRRRSSRTSSRRQKPTTLPSR